MNWFFSAPLEGLTHLFALLFGDQLLCPRGGDYSVIMYQTERAAQCQLLTGPYSRFGFSHPGPFLLYFYAATRDLWFWAGNDFARYTISQTLLNISFLLTALRALVGKSTSYPTARFIIAVAAISGICAAARPAVFFDIWGPSTTVAAMICFVCATAAISAGHLLFLPLWTVSAVAAGSTHLSTVYVIIPLAIGTLIFGSRAARRKTLIRSEKMAMGLSAILMFLALLPIAFDAATQPSFGNIGKILSYALSADSEPRLTTLEALRYISSFFATPLRDMRLPATAVMISVLLAPWAQPLQRGSVRYYLRANIAVAVLCAFIGAHGISGKPYQYIMMYLFGISAIAWILAIETVLKAAILITSRSFGHARRQWIAAATSLCALTIALRELPDHLPRTRNECPNRYAQLAASIPPEEGTLHRIELDDLKQWGSMASLVLQLYRDGYPVCVHPTWGFMFGEDLTCPKVRSRYARSMPETVIRILGPQADDTENDAHVKLVVARSATPQAELRDDTPLNLAERENKKS